MKTIFDYNPTPSELDTIGINSFVTCVALDCTGEVTENVYIEKVTKDKAIFDIALLLELRNIDASAMWNQIPDLRDEYKRGFDDVAIPID